MISLNSGLHRPYLEFYIHFWVSHFKSEVYNLEHISERIISKVKEHKTKLSKEQMKEWLLIKKRHRGIRSLSLNNWKTFL